MNLRKIILLMLPVTVAFLVGGKAGSIVGIKEFQWAAAFGWGTIIGIIDYNFSIMEKLGVGGWIGRIVLIMTSAIITATIGDHIIFAETIEQKIGEETQNNEEVIKLKGFEDEKKILYSAAVAAYDKLTARDMALEESIQFQIKNGGCGPKCRANQDNREKLQPFIIDSRADIKEAKADYKKAEAKREALELKLKVGHNIIKEIKVLYEVIFESIYSMTIFILLTLMTICVEILPLLLKSGITRDQWLKMETIRIAEEKRLAEIDKNKRGQTGLRTF